MLKPLKKIFKDNPEKSTIAFKDKCSVCGVEVVIEVIPSSVGFGLQGGALFEYTLDVYFAKCPNCYKTNPKIKNHYKPKYNCIVVK
jgi:rRNA maturation protein Nop10